ncbi:NUDIX hydrolase, partial [Gordonibacter pamelaeae]
MPETTSDSPAAPTIDGTTSAAASATNAPTASAASPTPTFAGLRQVSDDWIKKYVLTYTMPDGSTYEYESASRKGPEAYRAELEAHARGESAASDAVCIVPQTPDGRLLLIREFRYPLNSWCIAFPAGLVDPGEDLAAAVDRELR